MLTIHQGPRFLCAVAPNRRGFAQYNLNLHVEKYNPAKYVNSTYTNIFVLVIVILGLVMLDMYLQRKKEQAKI